MPRKQTVFASDIVRYVVRLADVYAMHSPWSATTVSGKAFGSGDSVEKLRSGKRITTERIDAGYQWFSDNWPPDLAWPSDIPRPPKRTAA